MEFGKLESLDSVDWTLPPDTDLTKHTLDRLDPKAAACRVYVGSTAWGQREFVGPVYPTGTKTGDFLKAYGNQFNCVELNTTFYRVPDRGQILKWYADTPDDFRFCPKVNKAISQANDLGVLTSRTLDFAKAVQHFEHKLGPSFLQLPADFTVARVDALLSWLELWPRMLPLAVELRHESWFSQSVGAEMFADFAARGIGSVITDVAGRRDASHMNVTAPFTFVRWVGTLDSTDGPRLARWAERIARWGEQGLAEAYVFTHEPEEVPSARAAAMFVEFLRQQKNPRRILVRGPQLSHAQSAAPTQGELFG